MIKTSLSLPILNRFSTNPIEKKAAISFKAEAITDTFKKNKNNVEETSSVKPSLGESYIHYIVGIDRNKNVKKILDREPEIKKIAGDKFKRIQIEKDKYSPDDNFVVVAELEKKDRYKEYFDTNLDRTAEEKTYFQKNENT